MAWPDSGTNEVTETIGATGRDYATIADWEAATDEDCTAGWGAGIYADPCSPVGECYADAADSYFQLYGATTDSTHYRRLTVAAGQRHDGTAYGGGFVSTSSVAYGRYIRDKFGVVEWLLLTGAGGYAFQNYYQPDDARGILRNAVVANASGGVYGYSTGTGREFHVWNCVVHDQTTPALQYVTHARNCSVLGAIANQVHGCGCINVISTGGSASCFYSCTGDYCISSDTSAPGAHSVKSIAAADVYADTGGGTEDLHLKSDLTAASDAGDDLSGTFTDDIDGDTRSDWDIGADEYSAPAAGNRRRRLLIAGAA